MKVKWVLSDREEYFVNLRREQFIAVKIDQKTEHDKSEQQWAAVLKYFLFAVIQIFSKIFHFPGFYHHGPVQEHHRRSWS